MLVVISVCLLAVWPGGRLAGWLDVCWFVACLDGWLIVVVVGGGAVVMVVCSVWLVVFGVQWTVCGVSVWWCVACSGCCSGGCCCLVVLVLGQCWVVGGGGGTAGGDRGEMERNICAMQERKHRQTHGTAGRWPGETCGSENCQPHRGEMERRKMRGDETLSRADGHEECRKHIAG